MFRTNLICYNSNMSNYRRYFVQFNNPVFITILTKNRQEILVDYIDILKESFNLSLKKYNFQFIAGVILKDHCHILIYSKNPDIIPKIVHDIKYNFTKQLPEELISKIKLTNSEIKRGEKGIWQRRYYDHIIRDENDLYRHLDYIHYNSVKHYNIAPKDWKYSSFNKFVKNGFYDKAWYNVNDKYNINNLDLD